MGPFVIAVGGGKGGVGKSMVSSNLAVQYAKAGFKVVLIDLDIGAANLHTIFGINNPPKGVGDYFITPRSQLTDYLIPVSIDNLYLAPGSGFVPEMNSLKITQKIKIIHQIQSLQADIVILDLGAGTSHAIIDFFSMTQFGVIVTSPEPTSIINAYEFLKNVIYRILFRIFKNHEEMLQLLKLAAIANNDLGISTITDLIKAIQKINPWASELVQKLCEDLKVTLVFNQAKKMSDTELAAKFYEISKRYLGIKIHFGGLIFYNEEVSASVFKMQPMSIAYPDSVTSSSLKNLAKRILQKILCKIEEKPESETFEKQFERVVFYAKQDYNQNILNRNRLSRRENHSFYSNST